MSLDLEATIQDALTDAQISEDPPDLDTGSEITDTTSDPIPDTSTTPEDAPEATTTETSEVASPASKSTSTDPAKPEEDDFEKKIGIPKDSPAGKENRIPYSRVQKIVAKAEKDIEAKLSSTYTPKITEYETKVKDFEERFKNVEAFEKTMVNEPNKFLNWLATNIPAYKTIFEGLSAPATPNAPSAPTPDPVNDMPQPDQKLTDGSMVYSMEGLKALNAWNKAQARQEILAQVEKDYAPIKQQFEAQQRLNLEIPKVQAQIAEARTWPQFTENEEDIVKELNLDRNLSLEGAYRKVVFPRIAADRNKMREDILKEIKKAPASTAAPSGTSKPNPAPIGPRTTEEIILDQLRAGGLN